MTQITSLLEDNFEEKNKIYDIKFMSYALNLSKINLGNTSSNPTVGAVITKNHQIISTGITAKNGRPHAETIAIEKIKDKEILQNATLYVTLEPCFHQGKTNPCVDEIIKYGFKKVVIATKDDDKRVDGKAIKKLEDSGIEVVCGILEKEAREINRAFFKSRNKNLPFITLKLATSLDGKIACQNFASRWITNEKSRKFVHYLRSINNAILTGGNSIRKDNPSLTCRIKGIEDYSPKPIIISNSLNFDESFNIFKSNPIILTCNENKNINSFAKIILCKGSKNLVDLKDALQKLNELEEINSILVECGGNLATQLLQQNLVDELIWIRSPKIIGNDGISAIENLGFNSIDEALNNFTKIRTQNFDTDIAEFFLKKDC